MQRVAIAVTSADRHSTEALAGVGLTQLVDLCVGRTEAEGLRLAAKPDPAFSRSSAVSMWRRPKPSGLMPLACQ
jgi:hypothetical protein